MVKKSKACLNCRMIYEGDKCPNCGESQTSETIKGKVYIFNKGKSEIAQNMGVGGEGEFAVKIK